MSIIYTGRIIADVSIRVDFLYSVIWYTEARFCGG